MAQNGKTRTGPPEPVSTLITQLLVQNHKLTSPENSPTNAPAHKRAIGPDASSRRNEIDLSSLEGNVKGTNGTKRGRELEPDADQDLADSDERSQQQCVKAAVVKGLLVKQNVKVVLVSQGDEKWRAVDQTRTSIKQVPAQAKSVPTHKLPPNKRPYLAASQAPSAMATEIIVPLPKLPAGEELREAARRGNYHEMIIGRTCSKTSDSNDYRKRQQLAKVKESPLPSVQKLHHVMSVCACFTKGTKCSHAIRQNL